MAFTVADFEDLNRLLSEHPEWRTRLRPLILGDEFLEVPARLQRIEALLEEMTQRQAAFESHQLAFEQRQATFEERQAAFESHQLAFEQRQAAFEERQAAFESHQLAFEQRQTAFEERQAAFESHQLAFEQRQAAFEERQAAFEERMDALEERMDALEERMDALEESLQSLAMKVAELVEIMQTHEIRLNRLEGRVGNLEGYALEEKYERGRYAWFGRYLRRPDAVRFRELDELMAAVQANLVSDEEVQRLDALDFLISGRSLEDGEPLMLAVEVSQKVNIEDVDRAQRAAAALRNAGYRAQGFVGGYVIDDIVRTAAEASGVVVDLRRPPENLMVA